MLLFQRRRNTNQVGFQGTSGTVNLNGILYAKWANFNLAGNGNFTAQLIGGTMNVGGNGNYTLASVNNVLGTANQVYLVE
jgi:hypothetical protein